MQLSTALKIYRRLQLNHSLFNSSIGTGFLAIAIFSTGIISIISIFSIICFYHVLNPVGMLMILLLGTVPPVLVSFSFILTANLSDRSSDFLQTVINLEPTQDMCRTLKSFPFLRTSFAGYFYSSSDIILVFFSIIFEHVITLCV